ncbi:hypothetical protein EWZ69_03615 [Helicobacter pylori]|nr:hypothetical protein [Helicobacter pylori]NHA84297.1 hypothetical protein [Helicobacter pylori]NHA84299.1 hypothetical protein [Helicobacter pylori]NHA84447.1 hypothetical protein [Helicobacter pylori]
MKKIDDMRHGRHCVFLMHVHLWSPSYFAGSCGGAPLETIKQCIQDQETPH